MTLLMQSYKKHISCVGLDGLVQAGLEKAVWPHTCHLFI